MRGDLGDNRRGNVVKLTINCQIRDKLTCEGGLYRINHLLKLTRPLFRPAFNDDLRLREKFNRVIALPV